MGGVRASIITVTGDGDLQVRVLVPRLVGRAVGVGLVFPVLAPPSGLRLLSAIFGSILPVHKHLSQTMRVCSSTAVSKP
jgi:hypothetical protein